MIVSVENEAYIFIAMFIVGCAAGLLFDIFKMLRMLRWGGFWVFITDMAFWICATGLFLFSVMFFNDGQMRWYEFVGIFLGIFLYFMLLSGYVKAFILCVVKIIYKILKIILKILLTPLRFLYKILSVPVLFVFGIFKRLYVLCINKISNSDKNTEKTEKEDFG